MRSRTEGLVVRALAQAEPKVFWTDRPGAPALTDRFAALGARTSPSSVGD